MTQRVPAQSMSSRHSTLQVVWIIGILLATTPKLPGNTPSIFHGSINIVMANPNGIVVLADSMQTTGILDNQKQLRRSGRKLFQLDAFTVCAVAGFLSTSTDAVPEFLNNTSVMIEEYKRESSQWDKPLTFHDKMGILSSIFRFFVSGVAEINSDYWQAEKYRVEVFLVGYDVNGKPTIGSFVLNTSKTRDGSVVTSIDENTETVIEDNFFYGAHGASDLANGIMDKPLRLRYQPAIRKYMSAKSANTLRQLTVDQMRDLAKILKQQTSRRYKSVGGPDQIAILRSGKVDSVVQPTFQSAALPPYKFNFIAWMLQEPGWVGITPGAVNVYVHNVYIGCNPEVILDTNFFVNNQFRYCSIVYDGQITRFGADNVVTGSTLIIGPHATDTGQIKQLQQDFSWLATCRGEGGTSLPHTMVCTDYLGRTKRVEWYYKWPEDP